MKQVTIRLEEDTWELLRRMAFEREEQPAVLARKALTAALHAKSVTSPAPPPSTSRTEAGAGSSSTPPSSSPTRSGSKGRSPTSGDSSVTGRSTTRTSPKPSPAGGSKTEALRKMREDRHG